MGLVFLFLSKLCKNRSLKYCRATAQFVVPNLFLGKGDRFLVTTGSKFSKDKLSCVPGLVVCLLDYMVCNALFYYLELASNEVKHFLRQVVYSKISVEKDGILYNSGRILPIQGIGGCPGLREAVLDFCGATFCVPLSDSHSPIAQSIVEEVHWYHPEVNHNGVESELRANLPHHWG